MLFVNKTSKFETKTDLLETLRDIRNQAAEKLWRRLKGEDDEPEKDTLTAELGMKSSRRKPPKKFVEAPVLLINGPDFADVLGPSMNVVYHNDSAPTEVELLKVNIEHMRKYCAKQIAQGGAE